MGVPLHRFRIASLQLWLRWFKRKIQLPQSVTSSSDNLDNFLLREPTNSCLLLLCKRPNGNVWMKTPGVYQCEESINLHSKLMPRYIPLGTLTSQEAHFPSNWRVHLIGWISASNQEKTLLRRSLQWYRLINWCTSGRRLTDKGCYSATNLFFIDSKLFWTEYYVENQSRNDPNLSKVSFVETVLNCWRTACQTSQAYCQSLGSQVKGTFTGKIIGKNYLCTKYYR